VSKRIVALDVGDVRIGIAVSDPARIIAQPLDTYRRVGYGPDSRYMKALCDTYETDEVLLGLPLNMDGSSGSQAEKTKAFGDVLQKAGLRVFYWDERLTSVAAERALLEADLRRGERKQKIDKVAAAVILTQWLQRESERK
jgi:putative holliday junction resolvase